MSATSASRLRVSRLNSVDLPTLGRPTMTTVGFIDEGSGARARRPGREQVFFHWHRLRSRVDRSFYWVLKAYSPPLRVCISKPPLGRPTGLVLTGLPSVATLPTKAPESRSRKCT